MRGEKASGKVSVNQHELQPWVTVLVVPLVAGVVR